MTQSAHTRAVGGATRRLRFGLAIICALLLMVMMGLTVADVMGRYVLNAPVQGATEVTEMLLAAVVFIGLPAASLDRDHIAVDILTLRLRTAVRAALEAVVSLASGGILAVVAWRLWAIGDQIAGYGGSTPTLKIPIAPLAYVTAILCALAAIITVTESLRPADDPQQGQ